jgi:hypothetical protein
MAKRRKASKNSAKKFAKSRKKRMGRPVRKAGKTAKTKARKGMSPRKTARMAVRKPQHVMNMLPPALAAMMRGRNTESVLSVLVVLFMLFATLSAGYFYPQPKAPGFATPAIMQVK